MLKQRVCAKLEVRNRYGEVKPLTSDIFNNSVERYGQEPDDYQRDAFTRFEKQLKELSSRRKQLLRKR